NMQGNMQGNMNPNMGGMPNMQGGQNQQGGDLSALMGLLNNVDPNQLMSMLSQMGGQQGGGDMPNPSQASSLVNALKPFMPPDKIAMVEQLLKNLNGQK
ncbi:MAG: hypothetical protein RR898_07570, partial [Clostridium sp.]